MLPYNDYFEYYGPDYRLHMPTSNMEDMNKRETLEEVGWLMGGGTFRRFQSQLKTLFLWNCCCAGAWVRGSRPAKLFESTGQVTPEGICIPATGMQSIV